MNQVVNNFLQIHEADTSKEYNKAVDALVRKVLYYAQKDLEGLDPETMEAINFLLTSKELIEQLVNENYQ